MLALPYMYVLKCVVRVTFIGCLIGFCVMHFLPQLLSRGLILWDSVEPSRVWVTSNIPKVHMYSVYVCV